MTRFSLEGHGDCFLSAAHQSVNEGAYRCSHANADGSLADTSSYSFIVFELLP